MVLRIQTGINKTKRKYFHSYTCKIPSKETWKLPWSDYQWWTSGEKTKTGVRDGEGSRTFIFFTLLRKDPICVLFTKLKINKTCNKIRESSRSPSSINVYSSSCSFSNWCNYMLLFHLPPSSSSKDTRKSLLSYTEHLGSDLVVTSFIFTPTLAQKQGIKLQGKGLLCVIF